MASRGWFPHKKCLPQGPRIHPATSTEEMSGGAGHQVVYDADLGKFSGYGSPEGE